MNYGYTMGAAGVLSAMHRMDVAANNLANIQTPGFKPDTAFTIPRAAARQEDNLYDLPSNAMLERLGAGVLLAPTRTSFAQGALTSSRNPLDFAIQGPGFFTVSAGQGAGGGQETRLTRDGRFTLDTQGRLVTVTDGHAVLDDSGNAITLSKGLDVQVDQDGTISQAGQPVAKLGFVDVAAKSALRKVGDGQFALPRGATLRSSTTPAAGDILQQKVEESGADPIQAMMAVQNAADQVGTTARIMQIHDDLMNRAINTLGRVTA